MKYAAIECRYTGEVVFVGCSLSHEEAERMARYAEDAAWEEAYKAHMEGNESYPWQRVVIEAPWQVQLAGNRIGEVLRLIYRVQLHEWNRESREYWSLP